MRIHKLKKQSIFRQILKFISAPAQLEQEDLMALERTISLHSKIGDFQGPTVKLPEAV